MAGLEDSSIERLKKKLYSNTADDLGAAPRRRLHETESAEVGEGWTPPDVDMSKKAPKNKPFLSLLLTAAIIFFVGSLLLAAFFFLRGSTTISASNIDIEIQGPTTIGGGEELSLRIAITNRNATPIESADLLIEYPEGARSPDDLSVDLPRASESVGTVRPGERIERTVKAVLFGEEGSDVSVKATLEYRVPNSNAIFFKDQTYDLILSTAPLTISVDAVEEITSGQEAVFEITVFSNSDTVIKDTLLVGEYPFGFQFEDSSPRAAFTNSVWELGDIEPEDERKIIVRGIVSGEDGDERVFRFSTGLRSKIDSTQLETAFITKLHEIDIEKPFIGAELALDGSNATEYVAETGSRIRGDIRWFNNLPVQIFDAEIEVKITGTILDKQTVNVQNGFYSSSNDTITFSGENNRALRELKAGSSGTVSFSFETLGLDSGKTFRNPELVLEVTIRGRRVSERNVPETVESTIARKIKISSDLLLASRAVYTSGPFNNGGPLPPQAEKETTYTILWSVTNSHNEVSNAEVRSTLPSYMRFVGAVSPQNASFTFNNIGGELLWKVGGVPPGGKRELAFQVALSPSVSQIGASPALINTQTLSGTDSFSRNPVGATQSPLTTKLSTDPGVTSGHERVVPAQ